MQHPSKTPHADPFRAFAAQPEAAGLYDPEQEKDACGLAAVATLRGPATHKIVQDALTALRALEHRGAVGAAGDIGHTAVQDADGIVCRCGNVGCLEAVASGAAVVRQLAALGRDVHRVPDVVALVEAGDLGQEQRGAIAGAVVLDRPQDPPTTPR